jgi:hypothetical protein
VGATTLHTFLADLFRAYSDDTGATRVHISGDDAVFDDRPGTYPFDVAGQVPGLPLQGELYPRIWPTDNNR